MLVLFEVELCENLFYKWGEYLQAKLLFMYFGNGAIALLTNAKSTPIYE